uniref:Uncharacterized protein n=3 Tax=unclassified Caudoviricetes TaxID=2788787 RepID=A0AB39U265_9CAUD
MHDNDFDHDRAQRLILNLKVENRRLKARLRDEIGRLTDQELPPSWHKRFAQLRVENARYRIERNEARAEVARLRDELAAVSNDG